MPAEHRADVVAGTASARSQDDCGIPAHAPRRVTAAGAELMRLARSVGLVKGEWVAIDGSKFQAVSSAKSVREREALERYLEQLEQSDEQDEVVIDSSAVASALGEVAPAPGAGSWLHAHHARLTSCLQRASGRRCRARTHCGATGDRSRR